MPDQFELDPERRLWKPSRRSFFFGLGAALIAPMLPSVPQGLIAATGSEHTTILLTSDLITKAVAQVYYNEIKFASAISRKYADQFDHAILGETVRVSLPMRFRA